MKYNPKIVLAYFQSEKLPPPILEYRFNLPNSQHRFDFAWPANRIALEVEGGIWIAGGHSRGSGVVKDMQKYNLAAQRHWLILRVQPKELCMRETVLMIKRTMNFTI